MSSRLQNVPRDPEYISYANFIKHNSTYKSVRYFDPKELFTIINSERDLLIAAVGIYETQSLCAVAKIIQVYIDDIDIPYDEVCFLKQCAGSIIRFILYCEGCYSI